MSRNNNKVSTAQNYIEHFIGLASAITVCFSFYVFPSLLGIPIGITSSDIGLKICAIAAGFKNYKSTNKRNKKKHDKIVLLAKYKLNSIEFLICKALIDSNISL